MENITIQLQEFLDGSLTHEAEAELLHRLSVSPERRELLRSYMKQQTILNADRASIAVPYRAEQKLWVALAALPPAFEPMIPAVTSVSTGVGSAVGGFAAFKTAMIASVALLIGLASGYVIWNSNDQPAQVLAQVSAPPVSVMTNSIQKTNPTAISNTHSTSNNSTSRISEPVRSEQQSFEAPLPQLDLAAMSMPMDRSIASKESAGSIPQAAYFLPASVQIREPGTQYNRPNMGQPSETHRSGFLERFDFSIQESGGKQFPNNDATNTSMPIITNSELSVKYMLTPHWWVGASAGSSNVTQKQLRWEILNAQVGPEAVADLRHIQTTWVGGLIEYRFPVTSKISFAANAGMGASTLGPVYYNSEVGLRFDITGDVGVLGAIRGSAITSNVQKQYEELVANRPTTAGRPPDVSLDDPMNFNVELSTGIYFHF